MAVSKAPPRAVQQRLYGTALFVPIPSIDQWEYGVANDWIAQYQGKVHDQNTKDVSMCPLKVSPDGFENIFIGESRWKVLVSWYGVAKDSSLVRRPTIPQYIPINLPSGQDHIFPNKNLDFLQVFVGRLEHLENQENYHHVQIYFWEQFAFLELVARRFLRITRSSSVRLWVLATVNGQDAFFKCVDKSILVWFGCLGSLMCAEIDAVVQEMRTRQATSLEGEASQFPHLEEVFEKLGLVITICVEELSPNITNLGTSTFAEQESTIFGEVVPYVTSSAEVQSDWDDALNEHLHQLTVNVETALKKDTSVIYDQAKLIVGDKMATVDKEKADLDNRMKHLGTEESRINNKEKELNEKELDLDRKITKFKQNLIDFFAQKKKLDDELKRIESQNKISESKVELNIGGVHFTTSVVTLTQEADSVLSAMFNGHNAVHRDKDGSYFIDRDGTHFRYILNFLREGATAVDSFPENPGLLKELLTEAKYYHLGSLITALEKAEG